MAIAHYLAMTGAEMAANTTFPAHTAWMACHFSPYGSGLSNLPAQLPPNSLLILNDRMPISGHDPVQIAAQLGDCIARLQCTALLLDFQRPGEPQLSELIDYLCRALPCPVVVSEVYAGTLDCAVFVSPIPADASMVSQLSAWNGREVWLDTAMDGLEIILSEQGAACAPLTMWERPEGGFREEKLHCHYRSSLEETRAVFTLWRTEEDIAAQLEEAEALGVAAAVGLYQEFRHCKKEIPLPDLGEGRKSNSHYLL